MKFLTAISVALSIAVLFPQEIYKSGSGGNLTAQYWTGAADATLTNEKNLGALGTGLVINTGGVPSAYGGTTCTNQFVRSLNASGAGTCNTVTQMTDTTGTLLESQGGTSETTYARGDILVATAANTLSKLAIGGYGQGPWSDGTDLSYKSVSFMGGNVAPTFTTSSTTYVNVTGLTTALPANFLYSFVCFGTYSTSDNAAGTTNGIGISVNGTGGTGQAAVYGLSLQIIANSTTGNNTTSTVAYGVRNENNFDSMTATASVPAVASLVWQMAGFYYSGTSGTSTFAVRVRSENGTPQSASIQVGSYCLFTRQG